MGRKLAIHQLPYCLQEILKYEKGFKSQWYNEGVKRAYQILKKQGLVVKDGKIQSR